MKTNKFWKWAKRVNNLNAEEETRTLFLNGTIAEESWFDDDVTPQLFKDELLSGTGDITVWINSPGGDCFAAAQIYNMLTDYKGKVTVKIDGLAASAASVIAMAGDKVVVSPVSMLMIHNPATIAMGERGDMERAIEMLDSVKNSIINAYVNKTGLSRNKLSKLMDDETWMDANAAIQLHFADEILKRPHLKKDDEEEDEEEKEASPAPDPDEDNEDKEETGEESKEEKSEEDDDEDEDEKKKNFPGGMLYSSRQMTRTFTNKVCEHYKEKAPKTNDKYKVEDLEKRLDLLHKFM